ncbi:MAG: high-potential iron-sulfur protein [Oligoflexia bacterium]|nr:high-potential iron-sulfur protein [Oligoflexia bacterium]
MNRRDFFKTTSLIVFGLTFSGLKDVLAGALPAGEKDCAVANDPVANALGYVADAKKFDPKKLTSAKVKKLGKEHNCAGCNLYTEINKSGWGKCTMIAGCAVSAKGMCGSWQKKAKKG